MPSRSLAKGLLAALVASTAVLLGAQAPAPEVKPVWVKGPTQEDLVRAFPAAALEGGVGGHVSLSCRIDPEGALACSVASESPEGWGFGDAALAVAAIMRAGPLLADGRPSANEVVELDLVFQGAE